jgi:small subunit ribosomal protein S6
VSLYECVLIARNDLIQQQVEGIVDSIASQLEIEGGAIRKRAYWGLRSLAYRIKKKPQRPLHAAGARRERRFVSEMERQLRLNDDILRFMTLRVNDLEEGPSAILSRKSDEHERNFVVLSQ